MSKPTQEVLSLIKETIELIKESEIDSAFEKIIQAKACGVSIEGIDYLRAFCFFKKKDLSGARQALREELRKYPSNENAKKLLLVVGDGMQRNISDKSDVEEFSALREIIKEYTMLSEERLYALFNAAKEMCLKNIPGNFVECGVAAGGSSALLSYVVKKYSKVPRYVFAFDSFEGMPPSGEDDKHEGIQAELTGWGEGTCAASEESVRQACSEVGALDVLRSVKGLFSDTLPLYRDKVGMIALLHMDGDWYESTMDILNNFYDRVIGDGYVQVDDYGYWEGCSKAIHEFEKQKSIKFDLTKIDSTGVWFKKDFFPVNKDLSKELVEKFNTINLDSLKVVSQMSMNEKFQLFYSLYNLVENKNKMLRFVEVGSYEGASLQLIYKTLKDKYDNLQGFCVDPAKREGLLAVLKDIGSEVEYISEFSYNAVERLKSKFEEDQNYPEIIFIDGDHTYEGVMKDIEDYYPLLSERGLIIFHDYLPVLNDQNKESILEHHGQREPGIRKAVTELIEKKYGLKAVELPLLYPTDPTQTQAYLPIIPDVFSTLRVYKKLKSS